MYKDDVNSKHTVISSVPNSVIERDASISRKYTYKMGVSSLLLRMT